MEVGTSNPPEAEEVDLPDLKEVETVCQENLPALEKVKVPLRTWEASQ